MSFVITFNAAQVAPSTGGRPVHEAGIYDVALVGSNEIAVKDKPGSSYAQMEMQIIAGPNKGSKIVDNLNLKNTSQQAVDIAYGTLSAICHVTGTMQLQQSLAELHGKPFKVEIDKTERDDKPGTFRNNVIRYLHTDGREPGQAVGTQQVQQVQQVQTPQAIQPVQQQQPQTIVQPIQPATTFAPAQPVQPVQPQPQQAGAVATPSWAQ